MHSSALRIWISRLPYSSSHFIRFRSPLDLGDPQDALMHRDAAASFVSAWRIRLNFMGSFHISAAGMTAEGRGVHNYSANG
jgi:hypothetical protein